MNFDLDIWAMLLKELFGPVECLRRSSMRRCDWIAFVDCPYRKLDPYILVMKSTPNNARRPEASE